MPRYNTVNPTLTTTTNTTLGTPSSGLFTKFTGTAPYTVTLASPVLFIGEVQTFYNATSGTVTVSTPSGVVTGPGGGGAATYAVPTGAVIQIVSDGTNYILIDNLGGALTATSGSFSSTVTMSPASANVAISPTGTGTVTISPAGALTINPTAASTINNTSIGASTRSTGAFTTLGANGAVTIQTTTNNQSYTTTGAGTITMSSGTTGSIDNMTIGGTTAAAGTFTSLVASGAITHNTTTNNQSYTTTGAGTITITSGTTGGINNMNIGASTRGSGAFTTLAANNQVSFTANTSSSTTGTGTIVVTGGVGISENLNVGGTITATGGISGVLGYNVLTGGSSLSDVDRYYLVANTGAITITLPATSTNGRVIVLADGNNFTSFNVTVGRNGKNIGGLAEDLILNLQGSKVELVYYNNDWKVFAV